MAARTKKPTDLLVANGWYLELPGIVSPHFETLSGLSKTTGRVEIVDAGTNIRYNFPSQILSFGEITLTRTYDGSPLDIALEALVDECIERGLKVQGNLVKLHHQREAFRLAMEDFQFSARNFPDFDVNSEDKFLMSYTANVGAFFRI
jgi:hypothetical protein